VRIGNAKGLRLCSILSITDIPAYESGVSHLTSEFIPLFLRSFVCWTWMNLNKAESYQSSYSSSGSGTTGMGSSKIATYSFLGKGSNEKLGLCYKGKGNEWF